MMIADILTGPNKVTYHHPFRPETMESVCQLETQLMSGKLVQKSAV